MILLTGFESYGGRSVNPAEAVTRALDGSLIEGVRVCGRTLPVDFDRARTSVPQIIAAENPDVIVSLGLWPGEPMIRLERVAINRADFEIADNVGRKVVGPIDPDGPAAHATSLPLHAIRRAMLQAGIPCRLSGSAGTFLCNALMYTVLDHCAHSLPNARCGFIHLPYLPEQVAILLDELASAGELELHQRADLASMRQDMMVEAVRIAIAATLAGDDA